MSFTVAVAGASGYAGGELLRLLSTHPEYTVTTVTAHSNAGQTVHAVHPHLRRYGSLTFQETTAEVLSGHDLIFVALPHGKSWELTAQLPENTLVVDAGADHRLARSSDWDAYYGTPYAGCWDYGVPELILADGSRQRSHLPGSHRIAAPGCNASTVILSLAPAVHARLIDAETVNATLSVGPSGAGKSPSVSLSAAELLGSANAYKVGGIHRHIPEIEQGLRQASGTDARVCFTPVLVPMSRGILAVSTARLSAGVTAAQVRAAYDEVYAGERFVEVLPAGEFPRTADVLGSNMVSLGVAVDEHTRTVIVVAAVDNLVKGTAGAAIQSANIALGIDEAAGLPTEGVAP